MPLGGRTEAAGTEAAGTGAGARGACGAGWAADSASGETTTAAASGLSSAAASRATSGTPVSGMMPFVAAGVKACATACSRPRPPRPRPPRRRRPRPRWPSALAGGRLWSGAPANSAGAGCASGSGSDAAGTSVLWRLDSRCGESRWLDSGAGPGACSASKYAGCRGGGAGSLPGSGVFFLRRCSRSFIHLRMFRLVTQLTGREQSAREDAHQRRQRLAPVFLFPLATLPGHRRRLFHSSILECRYA